MSAAQYLFTLALYELPAATKSPELVYESARGQQGTYVLLLNCFWYAAERHGFGMADYPPGGSFRRKGSSEPDVGSVDPCFQLRPGMWRRRPAKKCFGTISLLRA
jgi:hypothetical protein